MEGLKRKASATCSCLKMPHHCPYRQGQECFSRLPQKSLQQVITFQRRKACGTTQSRRIQNLKSSVCSRPFMDPGGNKHAPPALPSMMLPGHTSSPPVSSPLSGGLMPGKAEVPRNHRLPGRAPTANPPINGADFAPSKDRSLLIIQGTVQLCKSVGSLCLTAAFYRSGWGKDGDTQSPSCWVPEGNHPGHKRRNKPPRRWPHRGLCPEPGPTLYTGGLVAALKNSSEDLGMPDSEKTDPHLLLGQRYHHSRLSLKVLKAWNTSKVLS